MQVFKHIDEHGYVHYSTRLEVPIDEKTPEIKTVLSANDVKQEDILKTSWQLVEKPSPQAMMVEAKGWLIVNPEFDEDVKTLEVKPKII